MENTTRLRALLALSLGLTVSCADRYESEACPVEPNDGTCPSAADIAPEVTGNNCGYKVISVDDEATIKPYSEWWDTATDPTDYCCYPTTNRTRNDGCMVGRPMEVAGADVFAPATKRSDWVDATSLGEPHPEFRALLATSWAKTAAGEHASVAAFNRLSLELLRFGAPRDLVAATQRAAGDEVRHASQAYAIASALAAAPIGPGALPLAQELHLATEPAAVAIAAAREGCRDETLAALLAAEAATQATDPLIRAVLHQIADDESRHAVLSWNVMRWALRRAPEARAEVAAILTGRTPTPDPGFDDSPHLASFGVLGRTTTREVYARGMTQLVLPIWSAMRA